MTPMNARKAAILLAVLSGRTTFHGLAKLTGTRVNNVHRHMETLKRAGLVTWTKGMCGTIRPTCRWIPAHKLNPQILSDSQLLP